MRKSDAVGKSAAVPANQLPDDLKEVLSVLENGNE